jgi:hypothetical protein
MKRQALALIALMLSASPALAKDDCPAPVVETVKKLYPGVKHNACKQHKHGDKDHYQVKLKAKEGQKVELDIAADGTLVDSEIEIPIADVPKPVMAAFEAKYPKMKPIEAERLVVADKTTGYELAFEDKGKKREATFDPDGKLIEEE